MSDNMYVTIINNESHPVNVSLNAENTFAGENGELRAVIFVYENDYFVYPDELTLQPGENTVMMHLGYQAYGTYEVRVSIYQRGILLDKALTSIEVPVPDLGIELETDKTTINGTEIYRVDAYLVNHERNRANDVDIYINITDAATGEMVVYDDSYSSTNGYGYERFHIANWDISSWNISGWDTSPTAVIELSPDYSSTRLYRPLTAVVKGKTGESYVVNVTAVWKDQVMTKELVIPPS
jgi:hypothetical protein